MWWGSEIEDYRREIRAFAEEHVAPVAGRMDEHAEFDPDLLDKMRRQGVLSLLCPAEHGGPGTGTFQYVVAVEELSRICGSTGITVAAANSLGVYPIDQFGSSEQRAMVLPGVAKHGHIIAFGLTEPDAGSDAAGTKTTAIREGDEWVLNGSKCFITNGHLAEWIIATAVTTPGIGARGISSFLMHKTIPGFSTGRAEKKMGLKGSDTTTLHFDGVRLPVDAMLGPANEGFKQFMKTLDGGRISIGAMALGLAQGSYEIAVHYAKKREQFGRPIADQQAIQWKIADMGTQIETARHLVYQSAWLKDRGMPFAKQAAMAKLHASEVGRFCAYQAIQVLGGAGFMSAFTVERHFRDVKLCEIGEGTSEIQRMVISRHILREFDAFVDTMSPASRAADAAVKA